MSEFELIVPCHFGMESVLKNEIYDIGYEITEVSDGRVTFLGDEEAIARANVFLRTGEGGLMRSSFRAHSPSPGRSFCPPTPASGSPRPQASRASSSPPPISSLS